MLLVTISPVYLFNTVYSLIIKEGPHWWTYARPRHRHLLDIFMNVSMQYLIETEAVYVWRGAWRRG